jgi:hypothetical protein
MGCGDGLKIHFKPRIRPDEHGCREKEAQRRRATLGPNRSEQLGTGRGGKIRMPNGEIRMKLEMENPWKNPNAECAD